MSFVEKFETLCEELQIMAADGELSREDWAKTNLRSNMASTSHISQLALCRAHVPCEINLCCW